MKYIPFILFLLSTAVTNAQKTGCVSGDCSNGFGKFVYGINKSSGEQCTYTGNFKDGNPNGKGEKIWVYTNTVVDNQPKISAKETGVFDTSLIEGSNIWYNNGDSKDTLSMTVGVYKNAYLISGSFTKFIGGSKTGHYLKETGTFGDNGKYTTILHGWNGGTDIQFENTIIKKGYTCLSGDCIDGEGTLLYCNDNVFNSTATIFKGTFKKAHYGETGGKFKKGTMEIINSNKLYENGLYEIDKFKLIDKYDVNTTYSLTRFHPIGSDEVLEGFLFANDLEPYVAYLTPPYFQFRDFNYGVSGLINDDGTYKRMIGDYKYKPKPSKWLSTVYDPLFNADANAIRKNSEEMHDKQVQDDYDLLKRDPVAYYYKYPDRDPNLPIPKRNNNSSTTVNTGQSNPSITERNCPRCNGSGRVISTDNGGSQTSVFCGLCNGTGKVH